MNLLRQAPGGRAGAILGIRPEHLPLCPAATPGSWSAQVEAVEMLGAERLVYARINTEETMIVRTQAEDGNPPAIGAVIHVLPRAERLHWFDAATGKRL